MKIKILTMVLLASMLALTGCFGEQTWQPTISSTLPWSGGPTEYTVYSITKTARNVNNDEYSIIATGRVEYRLSWNPGGQVFITMATRLTYLGTDSVPEVDRGLTDSINASVVMSSVGLNPISSQREVLLADRQGQANQSHSISINYDNGIATMTKHDGSVSSLPRFGNIIGAIFDNEGLFFVMRSFDNLVLGRNFGFGLSVPFDSFNVGRFSLHPMSLQISPNAGRTQLNSAINISGLREIEDEPYPHIDIMPVSLMLNTPFRGPTMHFSFAQHPIYVGAEGLYQIHGEDTSDNNTIDNLLISWHTIRHLDINNYHRMDFDLIEIESSSWQSAE